jgi:hypothetical protein
MIKDLVESEGDEFPVTDLRKMIIRMYMSLERSLRRICKNNSISREHRLKKKTRRQRNNQIN